MAKHSQVQLEIQRLSTLAEDARRHLLAEATSLRSKLDVPTRMKSSLKAKPTQWLAGSLASGFIASFLLRRKPKDKAKAKKEKEKIEKQSFSLALLGLLIAAAKPAAKIWLTGYLKNRVTNSFASSSTLSQKP